MWNPNKQNYILIKILLKRNFVELNKHKRAQLVDVFVTKFQRNREMCSIYLHFAHGVGSMGKYILKVN